MPFSRQESKKQAVKIKQRRARTQAHCKHPDMALKHPQWIRDAASKNYTQMNLFIKEECEKAQERNETFMRKLHAKD